MLGKFEGRESVTNCREDKRLHCPTTKEIRGEFSFYAQDLVKQESSKWTTWYLLSSSSKTTQTKCVTELFLLIDILTSITMCLILVSMNNQFCYQHI